MYSSSSSSYPQQDPQQNWRTVPWAPDYDARGTSTSQFPHHEPLIRQNPSGYIIEHSEQLEQLTQQPQPKTFIIALDINRYLERPATEAIQNVLQNYGNWMHIQHPDLTTLSYYCQDFSRYTLFEGASGGNPKWIGLNLIDTVFRPESDIKTYWMREHQDRVFPDASISE